MELFSERGFCRWKLLAKPAGEMIGFCGVGFWRDSPDLEIGWWLARQYWSHGLATEAARAALRDAFERVGLHRVISIARPANTASTRIMEKLGLELECEFEEDGAPGTLCDSSPAELNHPSFQLLQRIRCALLSNLPRI